MLNSNRPATEKILKTATRILFGVLFILAGINHFRDPAFYLRMMPPYLPWHHALVLISGVAESALGIALLIPRTTRLAAWGLIALLVAVFPANIFMAMNPTLFPDISPILLYIRLPIQGLLILWAYAYTGERNGE